MTQRATETSPEAPWTTRRITLMPKQIHGRVVQELLVWQKGVRSESFAAFNMHLGAMNDSTREMFNEAHRRSLGRSHEALSFLTQAPTPTVYYCIRPEE